MLSHDFATVRNARVLKKIISNKERHYDGFFK